MNIDSQIKLLNEWREMPNGQQVRSIYNQQWIIEISNGSKIKKYHMHSQYADYSSIRLKELELINQHYPLLIDFFSSSLGVSFYKNKWFLSLPCPENKCSGLKIELSIKDPWLQAGKEQRIDLELARLLANKTIDSARFENRYFCLNCISNKMHNKENRHLTGEWIWFDAKEETWQLRTMLGDREISLPLGLPVWTGQKEINKELDKLSFNEQFSDIYNWEEDDQL
jgi:hypothetical protein